VQVAEVDIKKSRKGSENWPMDTVPFYIPFTIVLSIAGILFFIFVYKQGYEQSVIPPSIERDGLLLRFTESQECFAYYKDNVFAAHLIDLEKFSQAKLDSCYDTNSKKKPAFKISIVAFGSDFGIPPIATKNYDVNRQPEEKPAPVDVTLLHQNKLYRGEMRFEVQNT